MSFIFTIYISNLGMKITKYVSKKVYKYSKNPIMNCVEIYKYHIEYGVKIYKIRI